MQAHQEVTIDLMRENTTLRHHLDEMIGVVQWMSGSADFSPAGQAHEGWLKAREKLFAAMAVTSN